MPQAAQMVCFHMAARQIVGYGPLMTLDYITKTVLSRVSTQFISTGRIQLLFLRNNNNIYIFDTNTPSYIPHIKHEHTLKGSAATQ